MSNVELEERRRGKEEGEDINQRSGGGRVRSTRTGGRGRGEDRGEGAWGYWHGR